ncbi:MAG: HEAT repeat domain-containing protein [Planctomycetaceae bacterium]|jgi:HEAT repeat protein|nr:HEAT repeat domain-containing protein [Planctomycetaceae bacterium]
MKTIRFLMVFAVMAVSISVLFAVEIEKQTLPPVSQLASENLQERENAQQDWQNYCRSLGTDSKLRQTACEEMLKVIKTKETPVEAQIWLIRQLGIVGNDNVVAEIATFLSHDNFRIRDEAARALVNISGNKAAEALKHSGSQLAKDALVQLNSDRDILKKTGNENTLPQGLPYADESVVTAWMKKYDQLSDFEKAQTLAGLTIRKDKQYLAYAVNALKSNDELLRNAGILAMGALGGVQEIPLLLEQAFNGTNKELAKNILSRIVDKGFDEVLLERLKTEKDTGQFEVIADILSRRYNNSLLPILLERAKATDTQNRLALIRIAENLATKENVSDFVDVWELITDRGQRDQAEQIIARLVNGDSEPVLKKRTEKNYADMFSLLGRIGDEKSIKEITDRVFKRPLDSGMSATPELTAAALRAMCNWPDGQVANDLLRVAESKDFSDADRIAALRGFARVISLPNDRIKIKINDKEKIALLVKGFDQAIRIDEKRLIIQRAGQVRHADSLKFILQYFDNTELQDTVIHSVLDLAHHTDLRRSNKEDFVTALDKVIAVTKDQGLLDRAKRYKDNF